MDEIFGLSARVAGTSVNAQPLTCRRQRPLQRNCRARVRSRPTGSVGTRSCASSRKERFSISLSGRRCCAKAFGHRTPLPAGRAGRRDSRRVAARARAAASLFGSALISTPFCVYGGIVSDDADCASGADARRPARWRDALNVDYLELRNRRRQHPDWPAKELYVTFRKPIDAESEANMLAIPRKQRAMVRKGIQKGPDASRSTRTRRDHYAHLFGEPAQPRHAGLLAKRYLETLQTDVSGEDVRDPHRAARRRTRSRAC